MSNLRNLKKRISFVCGEMAAECLLAKHLIEGVNVDECNAVLVKIAELQDTTLRRSTISFDKAPKEFDTRAAYNKERHAYYSKAYRALIDEFNASVEGIVKEMNAFLPKK